MKLAVVTSVWGEYGRFVPDWLHTVQAQRPRPDYVVINDSGTSERWHPDIKLAVATSKLQVRYVLSTHRGMGQARNDAVSVTDADTDWVMHLDVDDLLLPSILADVARIADKDHADVVGFGAWRSDQGPSRWVDTGTPPRAHVIPQSHVLAGGHATYSCGVFRRWLWEKRPWITRNDYVDSVFWVGFAHLGARFVGLDRPGFVYRRHVGQVSQSWSREQRAEARAQHLALCRRWTDC